MKELIKWLKNNVGDNINIITPQFDRTEPLEYRYKPQNKEQFLAIVNNAPWSILKGLGFRKWDTMNNLIKENNCRALHSNIKIPIINSHNEVYGIDNSKKILPQESLERDEDVILFPYEWYDIIPEGFMVTNIWGELEPFILGESDNDKRFGCLAYGIRRLGEVLGEVNDG